MDGRVKPGHDERPKDRCRKETNNSYRYKSLLGFVHCLFYRQSPLEPETATGKAKHDKGAMRVEAMGVNLGLSKVSPYSKASAIVRGLLAA